MRGVANGAGKAWAAALMMLLVGMLAAGCQTAPATTPGKPAGAPDVIYVPTPTETVDAMLALAEVTPGDVLYDLGSGDGRIPITAAQRFGVRGVGIEINPRLVAEARANARAAGVARLARFREQDLFAADFREATVVTLYLLPELNARLRPKFLAELPPGARIVSHAFDMAGWPPERVVTMADGTPIYLWRVPSRGP
jgi:SAM-dependent methyltransferase